MMWLRLGKSVKTDFYIITDLNSKKCKTELCNFLFSVVLGNNRNSIPFCSCISCSHIRLNYLPRSIKCTFSLSAQILLTLYFFQAKSFFFDEYFAMKFEYKFPFTILSCYNACHLVKGWTKNIFYVIIYLFSSFLCWRLCNWIKMFSSSHRHHVINL